MKSIMLALKFISILGITQILEASMPDLADKAAVHSDGKLGWLKDWIAPKFRCEDIEIAAFSVNKKCNFKLYTRYFNKGRFIRCRNIGSDQLSEFLIATAEGAFPKLNTLHINLGSLSSEFVSPVITAITIEIFSTIKELEISFRKVPSENKSVIKNLKDAILASNFPELERLYFYRVDADFVEEIGRKKRYGRGFPVLNYISLEKGVLSREFRIQMAQDYGIEVDGEFFYLTHHKIATPAERQAEIETSWEIDKLVKAWEKKRMKIDGPTLSCLDI